MSYRRTAHQSETARSALDSAATTGSSLTASQDRSCVEVADNRLTIGG